MKSSMLFIIITFIFFISTQSTLLQISSSKSEYCFYKDLLEEDTIHLNYIISSEQSEKVEVVFKSSGDGKDLYVEKEAQNGEYKSEILPIGEYSLCFKSLESNEFFISFEFYSYNENGIVKELAQDKEVKQMSEGVNELKASFHSFEKNFRFIVDRRTRHTTILTDIITSIKQLTFLKMAIILVLSVFQVIVIQRFFGPDKRVTTVKGAFSDGL